MVNCVRLRTLLVTILLASVAAFLLIGALNGTATASPQACDPILYVDFNGGCAGHIPCYGTIQAAVDAACTGREIQVREGTFTGVQVRNSVTQVVYISKSVTIRGGFSTSDWTTPHPDTQPTILDAQGQGRVFFISGPSYGSQITPSLQGLRMTNGRVADADGGGLYAIYAELAISGCHVYSNTTSGPGSDGGGLHVDQSIGATLTGNHVYSNTASGAGGGLLIASSYQAVLDGNHIYSNTAGLQGGGLYAAGCNHIEIVDNHIHDNSGSDGGGMWVTHSDDATLTDNHVHDNVAEDGDAGGVYVGYSDHQTMTDNSIHHNQAPGTFGDGGGIMVLESQYAELTGNHVYSNTAARTGGGIVIDGCDNASLTRNQVYGNTGTYFGGGIELASSSNAKVQDNEVYDNSGPIYGGGLYVANSPHSIVEDNRIHNNQSDSLGGGIHLTTGSDYSILSGNRVHDNSCGSEGGGVYLDSCNNVRMTANQIHDNSTSGLGGGVHASVCQPLTLESNMIVDNQVGGTGKGAGIYSERSYGQLLHNTIANNTGGDGQGVYATLTSTLQLANNIIVSHEIGIETGYLSTASLDHTLWGALGSNITDTVGTGIATTNDLAGDPAFEAPLSGDYHITYNSPAKDAATDVGVTTDVDGDSRVVNSPPDIGADEYACHVRINDSPTSYSSVQAAIDAAIAGDTVRVAGACRSLERHSAEWQVAYIAKTLTLRGGYSTDFATWDPEQYPTTLDPNGRGRSVYTFGDITSRLESLRMVNGVDGFGAGIVINQGYAVISDCHILNNVATSYGGGLYVAGTDDVTLVNTVIADNSVTRDDGKGAGTFAILGQITMLHTTLARNTGGNGSGISALSTTVAMTNTVLVDHTVGITTATAGSAVLLESTLWGSGDWANDLDWVGPGSVTSANDYWLEPGFVDADEGDYHLAMDSPAIDLGVDTGVNTDIDGHWRPVGPAPDLGADEARLQVFLPLTLRSY